MAENALILANIHYSETFRFVKIPLLEGFQEKKQNRNFVSKLRFRFGRSERIRTSGLLVPNQALYQAEPHPETFYLKSISYKSRFVKGFHPKIQFYFRHIDRVPVRFSAHRHMGNAGSLINDFTAFLSFGKCNSKRNTSLHIRNGRHARTAVNIAAGQ